jgi:F0F1-type ATP synthase assembly protein I
MWRKRAGWILIIVSTLLWLVPFISLFLPVSTAIKAAVGGAAVVLAEVLFWLGAVIIGKDVVEKYRKSLFRWGKRDKSDQP